MPPPAVNATLTGFDRFSIDAQRITAVAQRYAQYRRDKAVRTEHFLWAIASSQTSAGRTLRAAGLQPERIDTALGDLRGRGWRRSRDDGAVPPFAEEIAGFVGEVVAEATRSGGSTIDPSMLTKALLRRPGRRCRRLIDRLGEPSGRG